ncbi:MAG: asparagine synthase (glutamine-hydrolyzing) [Acidobacteria bacterium]|nr:asparagine synthase (glutamine-hydrolyzing) [Acidobacteriota bacterium]
MCGICGIVSRDRNESVDHEVLLAMRDAITHRGPDDAGHFFGPGIALGSRRLSILDLSPRGHMPMATADERFWITYNGEVYNYRALRATLEGRGHRFRSDTDTEVVLELYADRGPAMLSDLNGMFALAIWDRQERTLFVARDRLGIKPCYYASSGARFYFASEEKALFAAGIPAEFDRSTWEELLCFRYVAGEQTPYVGIKRLLPGHYLIWKDGRVQTHRWWHLGERAQAVQLPQDHLAWYRDTFDDSVNLRRISDVPVGVLLSGGLDSSSVAASLASQAGSGVASFTVRFSEPGYDEGPIAQDVATKWRLDAHELTVTPRDLLNRLHRASWLNDEPLVHGNEVHLWAISEYAKPHVTVLLSGEGGDETLSGYIRYQPLKYPRLLRSARASLLPLAAMLPLKGRARKLKRFLSMESLDSFVLFNACEVLPADLSLLGFKAAASFPFRERVLDEAQVFYPGDPHRQAMYSDQHTFLCSILDRNDRMTMGVSIECRVPFLDYRLVEGVAALPSKAIRAGFHTKPILRRSLGNRLPESVLRQKKIGFGVPWRQYLRSGDFRDLVRSLPDA